MKPKRVSRIVLVCISSFLLYLSFPNIFSLFGFWPLGWISMVPLFFALKDCNRRERFKVGILFGCLSFLFLLNWVSELSVLGLLALVVVFSLQPIIFCCLYQEKSPNESYGFLWPRNNLHGQCVLFLTRMKDVAYVPALWVMTEFIQAKLLGGFSWSLGYSQSFYPTNIQIVDVTGTYGVSFVLVLFNYCFYRLGREDIGRFFFSTVAVLSVFIVSWYGCRALTRDWSKPEVFIDLSATKDREEEVNTAFSQEKKGRYTGLPHVFGKEKASKFVEVCAIQPDIGPMVKWDKSYLDKVMDAQIVLTRECFKKNSPQLVIWPETAIPDDFLKDLDRREKVTRIAQEAKTYLLVGAALLEDDHYYNSAVLLNKRGSVLDIYHKQFLIPFSEYLPWERYLRYLGYIFHWNDFYFHPGDGAVLFSLRKKFSNNETKEERFGIAICSENFYPAYVRKMIAAGAGFAVVMVNDAWFRQKAALIMHAQGSVLRAVENRTSIVHATNSGWTFVVGPHGWIQDPILTDHLLNQSGFKGLLVETMHNQTFYHKYGDIFSLICGGFVIIILFGDFVSRIQRGRHE